MSFIKKNEFANLADYHGNHCISIFLPTHRKGMEVNEEQDRIKLKNMVQEVSNMLAERGLTPQAVTQRLEPVQALLADGLFWRQQLDGLAIFMGEDFFQHYELPIAFEQQIYLAEHFYLRPLMPLFTGNGRFYLLTLSQDQVHFYTGNRYNIQEINVEDFLPEELRDVVGYDYEQRSLQHRSGAGQRGRGAVFHGQGSGRADDDDEIRQYLRAINNGLKEILHNEKAPLIIAGVEYLFPIYQEVNDYAHLYPEFIRGNTENLPQTTLHERAWELVAPHFQQEKTESLEQFGQFLAYEKASNLLQDIIPAAVNGRVETLFLAKQGDVYGIFVPATQEVRLDEEKTLTNASLLNMAAVQTFLQQGTVYVLEPAEMPSEDTLASAIFRY